MGLFGSPKIDGKELQECLACFEAETKVIAFCVFRTKSAGLSEQTGRPFGVK